MAGRVLLIAAVVLLPAGGASAQTAPSGDVTVTADYLPNRTDTVELRARVFAEEVLEPTPRLFITLSGFAEGLVARRGADRFVASPPFVVAGHANADAAIVRVQEASVKYTLQRLDLLAGFGRIAWGKLDELQPTDVVNPLDVSRFFFEGRSEARLPVALVRARAFLSENATIEGLYVPFYRRGRFDQLDEPTSPFNLEANIGPDPVVCLAIGCPSVLPVTIERREPPAAFHNAQGGARFSATSGRVDWTVTAYRGFEPFGFGALAALPPQAPVVPILVVYPRFTMFGGDFETVRGPWGLRGEVAAFVDDNFQGALRLVEGSSIDAGFAVDRKAGDYRISGSLLAHRESYAQPIDRGDGPQRARADVSLILSADRSFAAERYQIRSFAVYNATGSSAFLRAIATAKLRDNVSLEGSAGWFAARGVPGARSMRAGVADGGNPIGGFSDCDFGYVRVKYYF